MAAANASLGDLRTWTHHVSTLDVNPLKRLSYVFVPPLPSLFISYSVLFLPTHCSGRVTVAPDHNNTHKNTLCRVHLDEGSARRDFYLPTHNILKRQTSMPPAADHWDRRSVPPTTYKAQKKSTYTGKTTNCTNFRPFLMKVHVARCLN